MKKLKNERKNENVEFISKSVKNFQGKFILHVIKQHFFNIKDLNKTWQNQKQKMDSCWRKLLFY